MKNNRFTTAQLTLLGLMAAILLLMAYTPLGYLNIGPLAISFNVIPVAISAVVLGPVGGAVAGHETAADDDVMTAHQIFYIIGISKQSYKCCHEEQGIQECGKESGYSTGYIYVCFLSHSSVDETDK